MSEEQEKEQLEQIEQEAEEKKKKRSDKSSQMSNAMAKASSMAWLTTFADLMSLLMAFFVMLFALSEVDKEKFKILGYSLKQAFGVPVPTQTINNAKSKTQDPSSTMDKKTAQLEARSPKANRIKKKQPITPKLKKQYEDAKKGAKSSKVGLEQLNKAALAKLSKAAQAKLKKKQDAQRKKKLAKTKSDIAKLKKVFGKEIKAQIVEIEQKGSLIVVKLYGQNSFQSGSPELTDEMRDAIIKFSKLVKGIKGTVVVEGHTDNKPISTPIYRSNWDLSAARASTIVHSLLEDGKLDPKRVSLRAFADTQNMEPNNTEEQRAKNRRIEIKIDQSNIKEFIKNHEMQKLRKKDSSPKTQ